MFSLARWSREFSLGPLSLPAPTKKKKKKKNGKNERTATFPRQCLISKKASGAEQTTKTKHSCTQNTLVRL